MPYRETEGELLSAADLEADLDRFSTPDGRAWLEAKDALFYWHVLFNLRRNCHMHNREVPAWLESLLASAPPESEAGKDENTDGE